MERSTPETRRKKQVEELSPEEEEKELTELEMLRKTLEEIPKLQEAAEKLAKKFTGKPPTKPIPGK